MNSWVEHILFTLLPGSCVLCDAPRKHKLDLCFDCEQELPWLTNHCFNCAIPLPDGNMICGKCLTEHPPYSHCYSAFVYEYPIDKLILEFKENRKLVIGRVLASLLLRSFPGSYLPPDLLLPVPLHKSSLRRRGFNQSTEIAEVLSDAWSVPIDTRNCRRQKKTSAQKSLHIEDRIKNISGAFAIDKHYRGKRIAIIDDVVTTGATVRELANLLLDNGADSVEVICIARTPA
ncbi:MAG: ComF family protein [Pseudomonadales bacterium]|jgi:ComF family protein